MTYKIIQADVSDALKALPDSSFDGCLCDPPYGWDFMGKSWDGVVPGKEVWAEVLRVLKPGGHLLAFGGPRTVHRLVCAIEDGGFEIKDQILYLFGSGFPKSANISKNLDKATGAEREDLGPGQGNSPGRTRAWGDGIKYGKQETNGDDGKRSTAPATEAAKRFDGYGSALKPSYEPVCWAMKPLDGTYAKNALEHGVAGINVDGCRVGTETIQGGRAGRSGPSSFNVSIGDKQESHIGRFPANLIHDGSPEVLEGFPETGNSGSASRFFKCCPLDSEETISRVLYTSKASKKERTCDGAIENKHPTLKPLTLTEYLAALILPPEREKGPRRLLVPFSGAGSEVIGGMKAGWDHVVGIEISEEYCDIARVRIPLELKENP